MSYDEKKIIYVFAMVVSLLFAVIVIGFGKNSENTAFKKKQAKKSSTGRVSAISRGMKEGPSKKKRKVASPPAAQ